MHGFQSRCGQISTPPPPPSPHLQFDESSLRLRNIEQHRRYCALLDVPDSSRQYGVNRLSILDEAPHFDLCKCMPHDIMHVILEGVLPLHCKFLLMHCIFEEHYFTLKLVNRLIAEFEYGYSEGRNVPRQLDSDHLKSSESKLSQSGMCLGVRELEGER